MRWKSPDYDIEVFVKVGDDITWRELISELQKSVDFVEGVYDRQLVNDKDDREMPEK